MNLDQTMILRRILRWIVIHIWQERQQRKLTQKPKIGFDIVKTISHKYNKNPLHKIVTLNLT